MTVYLMDGPALVEQQEQWTADRRFIFLFPSSRAPREISRSPRLAHKAPVMQAMFFIEEETKKSNFCRLLAHKYLARILREFIRDAVWFFTRIRGTMTAD